MLVPIIPEANTDGIISIFLLYRKFTVNSAKPKADPIAAKLPLKLELPKSFQTIIKTPQKATIIDTMVEKVTFSARKYEAKKAVIIGAHANKIRALAAEVCWGEYIPPKYAQNKNKPPKK